MDLVEGDDLSVIFARPSTSAQGVPSSVEGRGAMPFAEALPIAKQIADAREAESTISGCPIDSGC
jgi:hypothetical protein